MVGWRPLDKGDVDRFAEALQHDGPDELDGLTRSGAEHVGGDGGVSGAGERAQAGCLDDGRAEPVAVLGGHVTRRDADPDGQRQSPLGRSEAGHRPMHRRGAADRRKHTGREGDHEAVTLALDLTTAMVDDRPPQRLEQVMAKIVVGRCADADRERGRTHEIAEQQADALDPFRQRHASLPQQRRGVDHHGTPPGVARQARPPGSVRGTAVRASRTGPPT